VQHAIFLGITTTIAHTLGVFGLGFMALAASQFLMPEQLYPWMGAFSGLMVAAVGFDRLRDWWRNGGRDDSHSHQTTEHPHPHTPYLHDHGDSHVHSHVHDHLPGTHEASVNLRGLLALGISGGLVPCPSALVVMLGAIALGRIAFGLLLITIFSLGLASVLTTIGIALVHAGKIFERIPEHVQVTRWLSALSALFITGAGLLIALRALATTGLFSL
jgi:nickel/cobalt transporter (NicO) family protein